MCDVTLLASRCHAASKPRSTPHALRGGSAGNITSKCDTPCLFTTQQGGGWARTLTDGISHRTKMPAIPHNEGVSRCGLDSSVTVRPWRLVWC